MKTDVYGRSIFNSLQGRWQTRGPSDSVAFRSARGRDKAKGFSGLRFRHTQKGWTLYYQRKTAEQLVIGVAVIGNERTMQDDGTITMPASSTSSTSSVSSDSTAASSEYKDQLMTLVKKEVKHIMEESVMLKTIHEESATVTALCSVVDNCLSLGLKRRALGLFKTSSTMALMQKLVKENEDAEEVMKRVVAIDQISGRRTHSTGDSGSKLSRSGTLEKASSGSNLAAITRFMWIRVALFEKRLQRIVCYLVQESDRYYTKDSLIADQDYGPILSSLLVGPCALEYTKIRANGHIWTDLPANELVQRHKISSGSAGSLSVSSGNSIGSPIHMQAKRSLSHASSMVNIEESRSMPSQAREYVESLHQNQRDSLLYGKNNVKVFPKDSATPQAGYLSLHQSQMGSLSLKWTPNLLMNGSTLQDKNASWQNAVSMDIGSILFMHCHQTVYKVKSVYMVTGDFGDRPGKCRRRTARTETNIKAVKAKIDTNPRKDVRKTTMELNVDKNAVSRIMKDGLGIRRTARTETNIKAVKAKIDTNPRKDVRKTTMELNVDKNAVSRIMKDGLGMSIWACTKGDDKISLPPSLIISGIPTTGNAETMSMAETATTMNA
eukprot:snap_masked-scaffold458_size165745-processed-gene-0.3 protein:Tk09031 transcript:snap_masked-scaffold458_size165745-processed-gene-0.3-mRNA-1 annotation:"small g protein signaling modulator 1-like"